MWSAIPAAIASRRRDGWEGNHVGKSRSREQRGAGRAPYGEVAPMLHTPVVHELNSAQLIWNSWPHETIIGP